ncbi:MAG: phytanoyl-CoA dioxygenase family protein [candidate division Zixibacteria bacterium]|nr:phytanoyl-CoA dioxygenase family protein [candidate division Zixibacteria bacterium]
MKLKVMDGEVEMGGRYLSTLREANDLLHDRQALQARMEEDGYLLIRGLQKVENVKAARRVMVENLKANNQLNPDFPVDDAVPAEGARGRFMGGTKAITHTPEFLSVVESPEIMGFFEHFLGGPSLTFDYKWLRAIGPGDSSGAHYDVVYMGRGTRNLYTVWTPLGDVPYSMGPLVVLVGSHRFDKVRQTYGEMDVDRDLVSGHFSKDPVELVERYGGQWQTIEFAMGDVLVFSMYTMHGSIVNTSNRFRFSADTRYQLASDPVDERWMGETPIAHYAWTKTPGKMVSMDEMRKKWDV